MLYLVVEMGGGGSRGGADDLTFRGRVTIDLASLQRRNGARRFFSQSAERLDMLGKSHDERHPAKVARPEAY